MSAIPWVGVDIVESKNIIEHNTIPYTMMLLPSIGIINNNATKTKRILSKQQYLNIPPSFISFFVGFVDGDGYIQITETTKGYIQIKLEIKLKLQDISTIEYIHSVFKLGKINISKDIRYPTCKLIFNKTELQEIIFPLLVHHKTYFLTLNRRIQFNTAMLVMKKGIKLFKDIPNKEDVPIEYKLPETSLCDLNMSFFQNWLVGFTVAEGCFILKTSLEGCFQLKQVIHIDLFYAFKNVFNTNRNIYTEKGLYNQFSVSSKTDIQKVINFFSFSGLHPLVGLKNIQYFEWLHKLKASVRYKDLNYPNVI